MQKIAGIDLGSGFTKAVLLEVAKPEAQPVVLGRASVRTGVDLEKAANQALEAALADAGMAGEKAGYIVTTGFGRYSIGFRDVQVTEITSGARGAHFLFPGATAVLDMGNQSTRAIALNEAGKVSHFKTNDKCAAGSGSFIARAAKYLQIGLENVGDMALEASNPQPISSVCAVLAESEIINHVSAGISVEDILCGIYDSLADRAALLLKRSGLGTELVFIGGVAKQKGMVRSLENRLKVQVRVPENCEYVCALGAALLGAKRLLAISGSQPGFGLSHSRAKDSAASTPWSA